MFPVCGHISADTLSVYNYIGISNFAAEIEPILSVLIFACFEPEKFLACP